MALAVYPCSVFLDLKYVKHLIQLTIKFYKPTWSIMECKVLQMIGLHLI